MKSCVKVPMYETSAYCEKDSRKKRNNKKINTEEEKKEKKFKRYGSDWQ